MIKYYDPNMCNAIHTVRITLMQEDYVGHISRKIKGDCKGADLLEADCFEYDDQDDIDRYVENEHLIEIIDDAESNGRGDI